MWFSENENVVPLVVVGRLTTVAQRSPTVGAFTGEASHHSRVAPSLPGRLPCRQFCIALQYTHERIPRTIPTQH